MPQSKQRALSRDLILSTALDLVDEEGLSALSLRSRKALSISQAALRQAALLEGISEQVGAHLRAFWPLYRREVEVPGGSTAAAGVGANPSSRLMAPCAVRALPGSDVAIPQAVMLGLIQPRHRSSFLLHHGVFVRLARHGITPGPRSWRSSAPCRSIRRAPCAESFRRWKAPRSAPSTCRPQA